MKFMDHKTGEVYKTTKEALEVAFGCSEGRCDNCWINLLKGDSDADCEAIAMMYEAQVSSVARLQCVADKSCYTCSKYKNGSGCIVGALRVQLHVAEGCPSWEE